MRIITIIFVLCYAAQGDTFTNHNIPAVFETGKDMLRWAGHSTRGAATESRLTYKKYNITVYFRCFYSGVTSSEPVAYIEKNGRWYNLVSAIECPFEMEASIKGDSLIFWRVEYLNGKTIKTEFLRFNLLNVDAIFHQ